VRAPPSSRSSVRDARPATLPLGPYLGPSFARDACERAAHAHHLTIEPASLDDVAARLAAGDVIGWFDGAMELGPRALGARSILADPRRAEMRDAINARVKRREPFRPFAPVVPAERARDFFDVEHDVPWMTEIVHVRPEKRAAIAAVVHVDGTARVQTLARADAPRLYALLLKFETRAGVPVLLNTSFNVAGEPIVCAPEDACRCMIDAGLDGLVLGDLWVTRR
jgi:carbamoyltransferase